MKKRCFEFVPITDIFGEPKDYFRVNTSPNLRTYRIGAFTGSVPKGHYCKISGFVFERGHLITRGKIEFIKQISASSPMFHITNNIFS